MSRFLSPSRTPSRAMTAADPFSELHREMNRLFDDFLVAGLPAPVSGAMMATPRLDVRESGNELCVCADLPGVKPEDVELRLDVVVLLLALGFVGLLAAQGQGIAFLERSSGRFQRSLQLPYSPDPSQVHAEFENGVLTIHVPKQAQQESSQRIEIQSHGMSSQPAPQVTSADSASASGDMPH